MGVHRQKRTAPRPTRIRTLQDNLHFTNNNNGTKLYGGRMTSVVCAKEDAAYDHASGTDRCLTYLRKSESCKTIPPAFESREPDRALELFKSHHKRMLGDLIHKEPELMDEYELDLIVGTLPFGSRLLERTYGELRRRQRALCSKQNQPRSKKSSRSEDKAEQAKIRGPRNHRGLVEDVGLPRQSLAPNGSKSNAIKYDALMRRKIKLEVAKSAVHGQGCYTMESIASNQFIVEYIGEIIPQKVADLREIEYAKRNIECSYLFTLDNGQVVDATTGGNHSRFINHSCAPNCATRIIKIEGTPKIVFFALKHIAACTELTLDYNFERELDSDDRLQCLCGSENCNGFLN